MLIAFALGKHIFYEKTQQKLLKVCKMCGTGLELGLALPYHNIVDDVSAVLVVEALDEQGLGQQQLDLLDIIGEQLFDFAVSHVMNRAERLTLQLFLQGDTDVFQRVVCGNMRIFQSQHI